MKTTAEEAMAMNHNKHAWIAVISFALVLTAVAVGKPAAGGDNGQIERIGKLIVKGFGAIDFPGPDCNLGDRNQKKGISEYGCNGDEGCHFYVMFEGGIGCNFAANAAGSANDCFEGFVEKPQGPVLMQPGTDVGFHCEKTAVVTPFNDLLWIPELCYPDFVE
jgi:hypothetical protein